MNCILNLIWITVRKMMTRRQWLQLEDYRQLAHLLRKSLPKEEVLSRSGFGLDKIPPLPPHPKPGFCFSLISISKTGLSMISKILLFGICLIAKHQILPVFTILQNRVGLGGFLLPNFTTAWARGQAANDC